MFDYMQDLFIFSRGKIHVLNRIVIVLTMKTLRRVFWNTLIKLIYL